jgi:hypothetical protein
MPDQAEAGHQPLHPLVVHPPAAPAKLGGHPRRPIGAARLGVDAADLGDQLALGLLGPDGAWVLLAAQAEKAEADTPAAAQAATTGNPAAFWASTQR